MEEYEELLSYCPEYNESLKLWYDEIWNIFKNLSINNIDDTTKISESEINYEIYKKNKDFDWNIPCILKNPNFSSKELEEIIEENKSKKTSCINILTFDMSKNINISFDFVINNPDELYDWKFLTKNKTFNIKDIVKNLNLPWSFPDLILRDDWEVTNILKSINILDYVLLSKRKDLTEKIIGNNYEEKWDWEYLTDAKNYNNNYILSMNFIVRNMNIFNFSKEKLSLRTDISIDFIFQNKGYTWSWYNVVRRPDFTLKIYKDNPWLFGLNLSIEECNFITNDFIQSKEMINNYEWNFNLLSSNNNLTWDFFSKHKDKVNWDRLTLNEGIKLTDIMYNLDEKWDWDKIIKRKDMTKAFIILNYSLITSFDGILKVKYCDIDFIKSIIKKVKGKIKTSDICKHPDEYKDIKKKFIINEMKNINPDAVYSFMIPKKPY